MFIKEIFLGPVQMPKTQLAKTQNSLAVHNTETIQNSMM